MPEPFREYRTRIGNVVYRHEPCGEVITWMEGLSRYGWGAYKRRWAAQHQCPPRRRPPQTAGGVVAPPPAPTVGHDAE